MLWLGVYVIRCISAFHCKHTLSCPPFTPSSPPSICPCFPPSRLCTLYIQLWLLAYWSVYSHISDNPLNSGEKPHYSYVCLCVCARTCKRWFVFECLCLIVCACGLGLGDELKIHRYLAPTTERYISVSIILTDTNIPLQRAVPFLTRAITRSLLHPNGCSVNALNVLSGS